MKTYTLIVAGILSMVFSSTMDAQDCNLRIGEDYSFTFVDFNFALDPGMGGIDGDNNYEPFSAMVSAHNPSVKKVQVRYKYNDQTDWIVLNPKEINFSIFDDIWSTSFVRNFELPKKVAPFEVFAQFRAQCGNEVWTPWSNTQHESFSCTDNETFYPYYKSKIIRAREIEFEFYNGAGQYEMKIVDPPGIDKIYRSTSPSHNSILVDGLEPNTTYQVDVRMTCTTNERLAWNNELFPEYTTACAHPGINEIGVDNFLPSIRVSTTINAGLYQFRIREKGTSNWNTSPAISTDNWQFNNIERAKYYEIQAQVSCNGSNVSYAQWTGWSGSKEHFIPVQCPQPTNEIGARNIGIRNATLFCNSGHESGLVHKHNFRYRLNAGTNWTERSTTNNYVDITGLTDGSLYVMQVQHDCGDNTTGNWSTQKTFTTDNCSAVDVSQITHQDVNQTTAKLKSLTDRTGYIWKYRKAGTNNATELPETNNRVTSITGLEDGTNYEYALKVNCDPSYSAYSAWKSFTTEACIIPPGTNIHLTNYANNSITFNYVGSGQIDWQYRQAGNENWRKIESTAGATPIDGLISNKTYEYRVRKVCSRENMSYSDWTEVDHFTTRCDASVNRFSAITSTSITVHTTDANGEGYRVRYRRRYTTTWTETLTTSTMITLVNLQQGTEYEFQISGICSNESGSWSISSYATTSSQRLASCDTPRRNQISVSSISNTGAEFSCSVSGVLAYQFRYTRSTVINWTVLQESTNDAVRINNLTANTGYAVQVRVKCTTTTWSSWSPAIAFRTTNTTFYNNTCFSPAPNDILAHTISDVGAILNCILESDKYQFRYLDTVGKDTIYISPSLDTHIFRLSGLRPNTTYAYQCRISCNGSFGEYSLPRFFTTTSSTECLTPVLFETFAYEIKSTEAKIACVHKAAGYQMRYKRDLDFFWEESDTTTDPIFLLSNLVPGEKYYFQVKTFCSSGKISNYSNQRSFKTLKICTPTSSQHLSATNISTHGAQINLQNVLSEFYYFRYRKTGAVTWITSGELSEPIWSLTELTANTQYEYQVQLYCNQNLLTEWSPSAMFQTATSTAIFNQFSSGEMQVYPNPVKNQLFIQSSSKGIETAYIITDLAGRSLKKGVLLFTEGIPVTEFKAGVYILYLTINHKLVSRKFIVTH